jgi:hypothetical protein
MNPAVQSEHDVKSLNPLVPGGHGVQSPSEVHLVPSMHLVHADDSVVDVVGYEQKVQVVTLLAENFPIGQDTQALVE